MSFQCEIYTLTLSALCCCTTSEKKKYTAHIKKKNKGIQSELNCVFEWGVNFHIHIRSISQIFTHWNQKLSLKFGTFTKDDVKGSKKRRKSSWAHDKRELGRQPKSHNNIMAQLEALSQKWGCLSLIDCSQWVQKIVLNFETIDPNRKNYRVLL